MSSAQAGQSTQITPQDVIEKLGEKEYFFDVRKLFSFAY